MVNPGETDTFLSLGQYGTTRLGPHTLSVVRDLLFVLTEFLISNYIFYRIS